MTKKEYLQLRGILEISEYRGDIEWAENVKPPNHADEFAHDYVFVVLNSGMNHKVATALMNKVWDTIIFGGKATDVFGHKGKAGAIDYVWENRAKLFLEFKKSKDVLGFCESLPWIGPITKYHLAKNLGADVAKPDRWLERVAAKSGETVHDLCSRLSEETGDRVATVDVVIWRSCVTGLLKI